MANKIYPATALTGGSSGALDAIDGALLNDGDKAIVIVSGDFVYFYHMNASSGAAESAPDVIAPDSNPNDKRWILQSIYGTGGGGGSEYLADSGVSPAVEPSATGTSAVAIGDGADAAGDYAIIGGGQDNTENSAHGAIGGGQDVYVNASSPHSTVAGGQEHYVASSPHGAIAGGYYNVLSGASHSFIGGGSENNSYNDKTVIGGGEGNEIYGDYGVIAGGSYNELYGEHSSIGGGNENETDGQYSTVPGGKEACASLYGQEALASGAFSSAGDAQISRLIARNTTLDATQTELFLDGAAERICNYSSRKLWAFSITVAAIQAGGTAGTYGDSSAWLISGMIKKISSTTSLVGSIAKSIIAQDTGAAAWDVTAEADDTNNALVIKVTGEANKSIRWVAKIELTEVT